mgnify:CR=1 FL=1
MPKRLLSGILIAIFVLQAVPALAESRDEAEVARYVLGPEGLGIVSEDILQDGRITRAEMTHILCSMRGFRLDGEGIGVTGFQDVPLSHPYAEAVWAAWIIGWIRGDGNQNFRPDETCTLLEAATMLFNATGWGMWDDGYLFLMDPTGETISYPDSYIALAQEKLGIDLSNDEQQENTDAILSLTWRVFHFNRFGIMAIDGPYMEIPSFAQTDGIHITSGWAVKNADGVTVESEDIAGEVINESNFTEGYVLAYQMEEGENIILAISEDLYESLPTYVKEMEVVSLP